MTAGNQDQDRRPATLLAHMLDVEGAHDTSAITHRDQALDAVVRASTSVGHLRPAGALAESYPRALGPAGNGTYLSTGRLSLVAVYLEEGWTVDSITFAAASTGAGTPTNQWFAIYNEDLELQAVTADDTTTAWSSNTQKTLDLDAAYVVPASGLYYLGICVVATTVPTLVGVVHGVPGGPVMGFAPKIAFAADSSLTNPASAPATATFSANLGVTAWAYVSGTVPS